MTVAELIERLKTLPADAEATYFHNIRGVISIDEIERRECSTLGGKRFDMIVLSGAKGDDKE